jgi:FAD/FMN-containing dehydrogenase
MRDLNLDLEGHTAWAASGLTAGEYTNAAGIHNLATGFGDTGSVGIGGLTLGGGIGYLVRKYGLTIDNLLSAEIVTADGQIHFVDAESHPDLFWAICGGGGNFGVVTRFQFRLHKVGSVLGGMLFLPATPQTITSFITEADAAPDELSTIATVTNAPPMPFLPVEVRGTPIIMAMLVYAGDVEEGNRVLRPFKTIAPPLADMVRPMRYPEIYTSGQEGGHPLMAARTMFVDNINRSEAETILNHLRSSAASMSVVQLRVLGGAMARVPVDATAFAHRKSRILVNVAALYGEPGEKDIHEAWSASFMPTLQQNDKGAYVNFLGEEGEARIRAAYPGRTWERLVSIKAHYDPTNLFHLNQNIPPLIR